MSAYLEYYLLGIILLPGIIFALVAQTKVNNAFQKYSKVLSSKQLTAKDCAEMLLKNAGIDDVVVTRTSGKLTDHFDPKNNVVALSDSVYDSTSIASIGVAAHEVGHAIQNDRSYFPLILRSIFIKTSNIASKLLWPLVIIGLIFNFIYIDGIIGLIFMIGGLAFYVIALLLNLITLPVEYNASRRALQILKENNILDEEELFGVKKVLNSAALTYVASTLIAFLELIRFAILIFRFSRDD